MVGSNFTEIAVIIHIPRHKSSRSTREYGNLDFFFFNSMKQTYQKLILLEKYSNNVLVYVSFANLHVIFVLQSVWPTLFQWLSSHSQKSHLNHFHPIFEGNWFKKKKKKNMNELYFPNNFPKTVVIMADFLRNPTNKMQ